MLLAVHLGDDRVGEITVVGDVAEFRLGESYRTSHPRPVLGQLFEDDLERVHRSRIKLPPFFSNLLPEGALRELLARQLGVKADREPFLLAHLGDDLPGAVRVTVEDGGNESFDSTTEPTPEDKDLIKFSLAGVQLKMSAVRGVRGLTIPANGRGGNWILKLPDPRFPNVPENEWSMMTLAKHSGLQVPDVELVVVSEIEGLPTDLEPAIRNAKALAVRRFDRASDRRIHMEDFAQILDVRPSHREKYGTNFETIARILGKIHPGSMKEMTRRLVFNAAIGNGDAHLKNWSVVYLDRRTPTLSPAYDLVSTIQYLPEDDFGLNFAGSKRFEDLRLESFERWARKAEVAIDVRTVATEMVERVRTVWATTRRALPMDGAFIDRIEKHWKRTPLLR
jgi:serine/threonine-protein kinase HipA